MTMSVLFRNCKSFVIVISNLRIIIYPFFIKRISIKLLFKKLNSDINVEMLNMPVQLTVEQRIC